jgi:Fur family ferric uptake transcriptional regulator
MDSPEARFEELLLAKGLRLTPQRKRIMAEALTMGGHFEAEDLHDRLRKKKSRVSRASVYRTLPLLVETGLLREVEFVDRHAHYEVSAPGDSHAHLICTSCRAVIEFRHASVERALAEVARSHDFEDVTHKVEIVGLCGKCRRQMK